MDGGDQGSREQVGVRWEGVGRRGGGGWTGTWMGQGDERGGEGVKGRETLNCSTSQGGRGETDTQVQLAAVESPLRAAR